MTLCTPMLGQRVLPLMPDLYCLICTACCVLPFVVLPDLQCWANKYVQAHFDNDPTEEVEALARLPAGVRNKVRGSCFRVS